MCMQKFGRYADLLIVMQL